MWSDLRRNGRAVFGLWVIGALALLALTADFIANDKPYYVKLDGQSYFPIAIDYGVWLACASGQRPLAQPAFQRAGEGRRDHLVAPDPVQPLGAGHPRRRVRAAPLARTGSGPTGSAATWRRA
jgi:hypothetical protein